MAHPAAAPADHRRDRVRSTTDLEVLDEVEKPIFLIVSSLQDDTSSSGGVKDLGYIAFQNAQSIRQYGLKRSQDEFERLLGERPEEQRQRRRRWIAKTMESTEAKEFWMDIRPLLYLAFQGTSKEGPSRRTKVLSKPIQLETAPGCVVTALMHMIEGEQAGIADTRACAMHAYDPIHTMMFDNEGTLLTANKAALEAYHIDTSGGAKEAEAACHEAMHAVFTLGVECHRHVQSHISKKDGRTKWTALGMWPVQDPVCMSPAVLVKTSNVTRQKELEMEAAGRRDFLERHNEELEQGSVVMQAEACKLQKEATSLACRLEAVMHVKHKPRTSFNAATPIDKMLEYLQNVIMIVTSPRVVMPALDIWHEAQKQQRS